MGRLYTSYSNTLGLYRLSEDRLIVLFADGDRQDVAWIVYDLSGRLVAEGHGLGHGFLAFRDGIGYQVVYPGAETDEGPYLRKWGWVEQ